MDAWYSRLGELHAVLVQAECADAGTPEYVPTVKLRAVCESVHKLAAAKPTRRAHITSSSTCVPLWQGMSKVAGARAALKQLDVVTLLSLRPADAVDSGKVLCVPSVTMAPVHEWTQEMRTLVQYAEKVWYGRLLAKVVEEGRQLPPASAQRLETLLEAEPNFSAARRTLAAGLPDSFGARMAHVPATSVAQFISGAITPIYETLPPRYVPFRDMVTQAMVNWWVSKLSRPSIKRQQ